MRAYLRARVAAELGPLVDAQIAQAKGLKYLVTRDKETGKFIRVGPALARAKREETIEVWEKDPSTAAWDSLAKGPYVPSNATFPFYDVSSDGQRFLMIKESYQAASLHQIVVVQNWTEELKQRVPTK